MKKYLLLVTILWGLSLFSQMSVSPANGNRGQSLPIIISGQAGNFSSQASNLLMLSQGSYTLSSGTSTTAAFKNISVVNSSTISADLSIPTSAPLGSYDLWVYSGTVTTQTSAFSVNQGSSSMISSLPSGGQPGKAFSINVDVPGASFKKSTTGIQSAWLSLNGEILNTISNIQVTGPTSFTADITIPNGTTEGLWHMNVYANSGMMYYRSSMFEIDNTFDLDETSGKHRISLYPNPAQSTMYVELPEGVYSNVTFRIFNISGGEMNVSQNKLEFQNGEASINVATLPKGTYLLKLLNNSQVLGTKVWIRN